MSEATFDSDFWDSIIELVEKIYVLIWNGVSEAISLLTELMNLLQQHRYSESVVKQKHGQGNGLKSVK